MSAEYSEHGSRTRETPSRIRRTREGNRDDVVARDSPFPGKGIGAFE